MNNKRKLSWLIIGGFLLLGAVCSSLASKNIESENNTSIWGNISNDLNTYTEKRVSGEGNDKIAIIRVNGEIFDSASGSTSLLSNDSGVTADDLIAQIDQAESDSAVRALLLNVNSPGGTAVAGQTIMERLEKFKKSGKKLYVAMREVAASAAYEISLPADKIFANPETQTGSIGVVLYLSNYEELYNKIGVKSVVIKSGEMKDIGNPDRAMTDAEKNLLQTMVDESYGNFVASVATWRKMDEAKVRELGDGRIFTGTQAKVNGLIDEVGNLSAVIDYAKKQSNISNATIVEYEKGPLGGFLGNIIGNISFLNSASSLLKQNDVNSKLMHLWVP